MGMKINLARRMRAFAPNETGNVAMLFALACLGGCLAWRVGLLPTLAAIF